MASTQIYGEKNMKKIQVFICYSSRDDRIGGSIKAVFDNYFGFNSFLAHDNLKISDDWPREVWRNLIRAEYVVPIISSHFEHSAFANQEIGLSLAWGKNIVPISIDGTNPHGFIKFKQAYKCHGDSEHELIRAVTEVYSLAFHHPKYRQYRNRSVEALVDSFCSSNHFLITSVTVDVMTEVRKAVPFTQSQIDNMKQAIKVNPQIYNADFVMPKVATFM